VLMLPPDKSHKTFNDYGAKFMSYIEEQIKIASHMDLMWDQYCINLIKSQARLRRGSDGIRLKVTGFGPIPHSWSDFLQVQENKVELFLFLSFYVENVMRNYDSQKVVVVSKGDKAVSYGLVTNVNNISPCSHEEADTQMLLHHVSDIQKSGSAKIAICTVDSYIVVLAVSFVLDARRQKEARPKVSRQFETTDISARNKHTISNFYR
jgi:hypothetical protein